jgi:16S rRNA (guanine527-N7)-methyltransferase
MLRAPLEQGLAALGLALGPDSVARLLEYLELVAKWNRVHNLTAVDDPERMVTHHLLDSLAVLGDLDAWMPEAARIADIGSGAGLPGIPLAIARPGWEVALVESSQKKAAFLRQAVLELGLANVAVVAQRAEHWRPDFRQDAAISRAFSDLADFCRAAGHLVGAGGRLVAMKGVHPHEELAQLPAGWAVERVARVGVPGLGAERHLVIMRMT